MSANQDMATPTVRSHRSRFDRQATGRIRIQPRDIEILVFLYRARAATREHLIDHGFFTSVARGNSRLRALFDHRLVDRHFPPAARYGAQPAYCATPKAAAYIAAAIGKDAQNIRKVLSRGIPVFLEHALRTQDIHSAFHRSCSQHHWSMQWHSEIDLRDLFEYQTDTEEWQREYWNPDGAVVLSPTSTTIASAWFVIECDLGHTGSQQWRSRLQTSLAYIAGDLFTQRFEAKAYTLLIVTSGGTARIGNLLSLCQEEGMRSVAITTFDALYLHHPFAPIWWTLDSPQGHQSLLVGQGG